MTPLIRGALYSLKNLSNDIPKEIKGEPFGIKEGLFNSRRAFFGKVL